VFKDITFQQGLYFPAGILLALQKEYLRFHCQSL
jgi:hypothetical protein